MTTSAIDAFGTLLQLGNGGSPETYTSIAEVTNISGPNLSLDLVEVTNHQSTGGWKERIGTLLDGGTISLDLNLIPTGATHRDASGGMLDDMLNKTLRNMKLVFPDTGSTSWTFAAFVNAFNVSAPVEGKLGASVTITISGAVTLA